MAGLKIKNVLLNVRKDFPFFEQGLIYLDSAATSQKPRFVLDAVREFYENNNANVHRGIYLLAEEATELYESARKTVADFIGADADEIVFVRNATEGINLVAHTFGDLVVGKNDAILLTEMEHHSNIVPWQLLAQRKGARVSYVPVTVNGELDFSAVKSALAQKPKIFAFTHVSNVLGAVNPAKEFIDEAQKHGVPVLLDASQSVPGMPVNVKELGCDFLVFSGHKILGPHIGVLYGKRELLKQMPPFLAGGGMIKKVSSQTSTFIEPPWKFEAGTFDVPSAVGLASAIKYLKNIGVENVRQHAQELIDYAFENLSNDSAVKIYGSKERLNLLSFNLGDMHAHDVAAVLDEFGVCVRAGHHCAQPLMDALGIPACVRLSVGVYNTKEDIDKFLFALKHAKKVFRL